MRPPDQQAKAHLAREFRYDEAPRAQIVNCCRPFLSSAGRCEEKGLSAQACCIALFEGRARSWLEDYALQRPKMRLKEHKTDLRDATAATWRLADRFRRLDQWWAAQALDVIARHVERGSGRTDVGHRRKKGMHDEMRFWLCATIIEILVSETGKLPAQSRTSVAAGLLVATVSPVMQYARDVLGCEKAAPLENGGKAEYMIARWLGLFNFVQPWDD